MIIYLDKDFKCYTSENENIILSIETNYFDGKCKEYIEGYRYIPMDKEWTNEEGIKFSGEMVAPAKDYNDLDRIQRLYEQELIKKQEAIIAELDAALLDMAYSNLV